LGGLSQGGFVVFSQLNVWFTTNGRIIARGSSHIFRVANIAECSSSTILRVLGDEAEGWCRLVALVNDLACLERRWDVLVPADANSLWLNDLVSINVIWARLTATVTNQQVDV
jgi:hypothetical protein